MIKCRLDAWEASRIPIVSMSRVDMTSNVESDEAREKRLRRRREYDRGVDFEEKKRPMKPPL